MPNIHDFNINGMFSCIFIKSIVKRCKTSKRKEILNNSFPAIKISDWGLNSQQLELKSRCMPLFQSLGIIIAAPNTEASCTKAGYPLDSF